MKILPFAADHLTLLEVQEAQAEELRALRPEARAAYALASAPGLTIVRDGRVLMCTGLLPITPMRALLWAFLSKHARSHLVGITKIGLREIAASPYQRVEATVAEDFDAGHRWMALMGFTLETPDGMPCYDMAGDKHYLYARMK